MKKIIGRGVLLLETTPNGSGLKFGYQLSSDGIQLATLGGNAALQSLSIAVKQSPLNSPSSVTGKGHLILNALPASPNDAFYDVTFSATDIGKTTESFTLQVRESGAFAHGLQSHFSTLDITFKYSKSGGLSIVSGGMVSLHLAEGVFDAEKVLQLAAKWDAARETLIFNAASTTMVQMDEIGTLKNIEIELGPAYDRWAQVQGLYTFDGGMGKGANEEFAAHDISGQGAPSLYFDGKDNFNKSQIRTYGAKWKERGISFEADGFLASPDNLPNPVVDAIQDSEAFSVEIWMKPAQVLQEGPARVFTIEGPGYDNFFVIGQGPWNEGPYKKNHQGPGSYLNVNFKYRATGLPDLRNDWEKPFKSPANSLGDALMHVVYSSDQEGTQRIFINGVQLAHRFDPGYYNAWLGMLRIALGNDLQKNKPWKGEVQQLAIYSRALTPEEVSWHYQPVIKVTGEFFGLDNIFPPLKDEGFPFHLSIREDASTLVAASAVDYEINPRIGFRHVHLECLKPAGSKSKWSFSGKFLTRFWNDLIPLNAALDTSSRLRLSSPDAPAGPVSTSKFNAVELQFMKDQSWELSFGANQEIGVVPLVLEHAMPGYEEFRLGSPHIVLAESGTMDGKWLGESITFTTAGTGTDRVLNGSTSFSLPFTLDLPPKVDPETGDIFGDLIKLDDVMAITLDVELGKDGFQGKVKDISFSYKNKKITLPNRTIYTPPASKMALLGTLLEEVKATTDTLFGGLRKHAEDYYLDIKANKPYIHLSAASTPDTEVSSDLPKIFAKDFESTEGKPIFSLLQQGSKCTLTLIPGTANSTDIRSAYKKLMTEVEDTGGLSAGGLRLLQSRIAERLQMNYDDLLYYHYGWDIANNYIDLHPGMRLRVDFQNYQFVHITEQKAKNGFAGAGSIFIPIHSYTHDDGKGSQYLGFGPFLSRLQANHRGNIPANGAGGLLDLAKTGSRKPFFRLFFPNEAISASAPERSATIVGAKSWQQLGTDIAVQADATDNVISFFFRDKAMIIPEIQVFVGNQAVYVPVGTTVRQLVEKYANIPEASASKPNLRAFLGKARPRRLIHTGPDSMPAYRFLNPDTNKVAKNQDIFDLPLIKGDKFYF